MDAHALENYDELRQEIVVTISVRPEIVPGWGYNPQDMADAASAAVCRVLSSYDPKVVKAKVNLPDDSYKRLMQEVADAKQDAGK